MYKGKRVLDGAELQNILQSNQNFGSCFCSSSSSCPRLYFGVAGWQDSLARVSHLLARVHHPPMRLYTESRAFCWEGALDYREKERVCLPPPFHVWLSWGSSYRCPNQSSACVVLSDVVELAELAELCCCGDELETSFVRSLFHIHLTLLSVELLFIRPLCSGRSFRPFFSVSFGVLFVSSTTL
ncbi:hypothetical protein OUZ56_002037 [Daphnia magna]|uniref:Uncharacterized protein n=1 Tax=Daphnia magna TaxID=35525 RepID=A0ABR0A4I5_9CRUS|nr:hypothetical protein OUZ56_002037 [Daphnia magna]